MQAVDDSDGDDEMGFKIAITLLLLGLTVSAMHYVADGKIPLWLKVFGGLCFWGIPLALIAQIWL